MPKDRIIVWADGPASPTWSRLRYVSMTGVSERHPDGLGWDLVEHFSEHCLVDSEQAEAWFSRPGLDERYQLMMRV